MTTVEASQSLIARAYRMRCYPTKAQTALLSRLRGATRFVWNWALATRTDAWREREERVTWGALSRTFTALRTAPATSWLAELPREPFCQVLRDQEKAFANFFGKRSAYSKFRSKRHSTTGIRFTLDQRRDQVERGDADSRWARVCLPRLGTLKLRRVETLDGRLRSITLRVDGAGRWWATLTADGVKSPVCTPARTAAVGLDAGLKDRLVGITSEGSIFRLAGDDAAQRHRQRLRRYQRRQSRQLAHAARAAGLDPTKPLPKGTRLAMSKRRAKTRTQIARLQARIANTRREQLHRATTAVVRLADVVCLENLAVKAIVRGMGRRGFRRRAHEAALGEIRRQLTYKASWAGRTVVAVDRSTPVARFAAHAACGIARCVCRTASGTAPHAECTTTATRTRRRTFLPKAFGSSALPRRAGEVTRGERLARWVRRKSSR